MEKKSPIEFATNIREFQANPEYRYCHASQMSEGWQGPSPLEYTAGATRTYDYKGNPHDADHD